MIQRRHLGAIVLAAVLGGVALAGQAIDSTESELVSLVQEAASLRGELAGFEERILAEGTDDLLLDEIRNFELEERIQDLGDGLLSIEDVFLTEEKATLLDDALTEPSTPESRSAGLELLRIEELIALAKGEIAAAWHESSLIQQKLTLELKRALSDIATASPPEACIDAPLEVPVGTVVELLDCSSDPDGEIVSWEWDLGDGSRSSEQNPVHVYERPGTYTVTLRVVDDQGLSDSVSRQIRVVLEEGTGSFQVVPSEELLASRGPVPRDILLVLDLSSSMDELTDDLVSKIDVAKSVLQEVVGELPEDSLVGLRTFRGCESSELLIPLEPVNPDVFATVIEGLTPKGLTPLAFTIDQIAVDLRDIEGPHLVIFVTDGLETCGGDPVSAAEALAAGGAEVVFKLVGYDIESVGTTAQRQLLAIAEAADGDYVDVRSTADLLEAIQSVLPLSYRILDAEGEVVSEGFVGDPAIDLPSGTYSVLVETVPQLVIEDIIVRPNEVLTITVSPGHE
jgi:PKD repeat protein